MNPSDLKSINLEEIGPSILKFAKEDKHLSVQQLADHLGITQSRVSNRWGESNIKISELEKSCRFLGINLEIRIGGLVFRNEIEGLEDLSHLKEKVELQQKLIEKIEEVERLKSVISKGNK